MAAKELRTSSEDAHSAAAWRVPRLPTDEEIAAMETGGEKKKAFLLGNDPRGDRSDGLTSANSAEFMADKRHLLRCRNPAGLSNRGLPAPSHPAGAGPG